MAQRSSVDDRSLRPPRQKTGNQRPSTAPHSGTPDHQGKTLRQSLEITPEESHGPNSNTKEVKPGHSRFVLTDPVAFRYLEEDPSTTALERRVELQGYECYVVEQWTTSRAHPTFFITTYTGDQEHTVTVGVLSVPSDERSWSPRLRVYFKALNQYHARRRETPLGILMVTNLSTFPSSLTVIHIPNGDSRKYRFEFFVNEDLKRLGCSGRVGLTLSAPAPATVAKFHQLYRTSDKNDVYQSVIELVKLCQSALMLFDKLEIDYADGLLCDVTERGINDWWVELGNEHYDTEPHDGILGPTTVAGLLGLLMGARNRLHAVGAPVAKDAFDVEAMKRGIGHFQKQQHISRTRRLDRQTITRLHKATRKTADHTGWAMPKVLKNTAAELSGKGGEMVMDAVGGRDRAGIAEIETCDIDRFVQLLFGERPKWLWLGKPLKSKTPSQPVSRRSEEDGPGLNKGLVFKPDEHGGFTWTARKSAVEGLPPGSHKESVDFNAPATSGEQEESDTTDDDTRFGMFKRASGLKEEAKSGLGKFKGAVGLKSHHHKSSADDPPTTPVEDGFAKKRPLFRRVTSSPVSSQGSPQSPNIAATMQQGRDRGIASRVDVASIAEEAEDRVKPTDRPDEQSTTAGRARPDGYKVSFPEGDRNAIDSRESLGSVSNHETDARDGDSTDSDQASMTDRDTVTADASIAGSIYNGIDLNEALPTGPETEADVPSSLRRTTSLSQWVSVQLEHRPDDVYPRHLSFSLAEESILTWPEVTAHKSNSSTNDPYAMLAAENLTSTQAKEIQRRLTSLLTSTHPWTQSQLSTLETFLDAAGRDQDHLDSIHQPHLEHVNYLQSHAEGVLREQRERLEEGGKEVETLAAKMEYEIGGLRGRVEDVEAGVQDFGKGVRRVEERVLELEKDAERAEQSRWASCAVM